MKLTDKEIAEYLHRCYTAVDGLMFVKVEEKYGFDVAPNIDEEVWKVMPKIQSRFLKNKLKKDQQAGNIIIELTINFKMI